MRHMRAECAFCDSTDVVELIDFGLVALAGAFLRPSGFSEEKKYPLRLVYCKDCYAVQVADHVPPSELFHSNYFYFSSSIGTLRAHFQTYAEALVEQFLSHPEPSVLEFGCNDGVLLKPLADKGVKTLIGVDPSKNVVASIDDSRITTVNDFFTETVADDIVSRFGKMDVVLASNVYAHISDIQGTTRAIKRVLKDDGVFAFEVHYLGKVIEDLQYDMIYHEHLYYYSMLSAMKHFDRYGMMIFDIKLIPVHGGSVRFYVCNKGSKFSHFVSDAAKQLEAEELAKGFDHCETFLHFSKRVTAHRMELVSLLNELRSGGATIAGYGASGRANTIIQWCGLTSNQLSFMIDDAPAKLGYFTPGSHIEIFSSSILKEKDAAPTHLLIFAWAFLEEILRRNEFYVAAGGKMIVPLPAVRLVDQSTEIAHH